MAGLFVVVLTLAVYLLIPTNLYYWDGVAFAAAIEKAGSDGRSLAHPNHLLYSVLCHSLYRLAHAIGFETRALFLMQTLNSVLAAASAGLLFAVIRRSGAHAFISAALALGFSFTATWWRFATDANAYIPSVFFLLVCYVLLHREGRVRTLPAALAHSAAMLLHQLSVFFLPVVCFLILRGDGDAREKRKALLLYGGIAGGITLAVYAYAYSQIAPTLQVSLATWMIAHAPDAGFSLDPVHSLGLSAQGSLRLIFGGKLGSFRFDTVSAAVTGLFAASAVGLVTSVLLSNSPQNGAGCGNEARPVTPAHRGPQPALCGLATSWRKKHFWDDVL